MNRANNLTRFGSAIAVLIESVPSHTTMKLEEIQYENENSAAARNGMSLGC